MFNNLISYYFTGTGNSYRISSWVVERAKRKAIDAKSVPINKYNKEEFDTADVLNLCYPTHAFTAPWSVIKFVLKLPKGNNKKVIITTARGGGTFLKDTPGCEGTANYLIAFILAIKGYEIIASDSIDMPVNWNVMAQAYPSKKNEHIINTSRNIVYEFIDEVLSEKKRLQGIISLIVGIIVLPLSVLYLIAGRLFFPKMFFSNHKCTGCGLCAKACPTQSIKMLGKNKRPYWSFNCENCMRCTAYCPQNAVEANHIVLIFAIFLALDTNIFIYMKSLLAQVFGNTDFNYLLSTITQIIFALIFSYMAHIVIYLLNRSILINKILTYLSITHYMRRYKEPDTKLEEII